MIHHTIIILSRLAYINYYYFDSLSPSKTNYESSQSASRVRQNRRTDGRTDGWYTHCTEIDETRMILPFKYVSYYYDTRMHRRHSHYQQQQLLSYLSTSYPRILRRYLAILNLPMKTLYAKSTPSTINTTHMAWATIMSSM